MGEKDRVTALAEDLRDLRRRGLASIDVDVAGQPSLALSQLESLARRYARDSAEPRIELIRRLLHDALQAYRQAGYQHDAQLLGLLFFDDGTGETSATSRPGIFWIRLSKRAVSAAPPSTNADQDSIASSSPT